MIKIRQDLPKKKGLNSLCQASTTTTEPTEMLDQLHHVLQSGGTQIPLMLVPLSSSAPGRPCQDAFSSCFPSTSSSMWLCSAAALQDCSKLSCEVFYKAKRHPKRCHKDGDVEGDQRSSEVSWSQQGLSTQPSTTISYLGPLNGVF